MPFNGSGTFDRSFPPGGWQGDATANIKIRADRHDQHDADLASGLSNAICKDGQTSITADIPFNGRKIVNLGAPATASDAATKGYVDGIKTFSTGITLSGAGTNTRIEYPQADMSFFVRSIGDPLPADITPRFVWNDKSDGTGVDVARMDDTGKLALDGAAFPTGSVMGLIVKGATSTPTLGLNSYSNGATWKALTTGFGGYLYLDKTTGMLSLTASTASAVADADLLMGDRMTLDSSGVLTAGASVVTTTGYVTTPAAAMIVAASGAGQVILRPQGSGSGSGQFVIDTGGNASVAGALTVTSNVAAAGNLYAANLNMNFGTGGLGRIMQFQGSWYWDFVTASGQLLWRAGPSGHNYLFDGAGNFTISGTLGIKASGTTWANPSDARIKTVTGNYEAGLAEILQLQPRTFTYKDNYTTEADGRSPYAQMAADATEIAGFVAQEVETVMPGMVSQGPGFIDGEEVQDFRTLDQSNLILALVNAVKELSAKVEALEAAQP